MGSIGPDIQASAMSTSIFFLCIAGLSEMTSAHMLERPAVRHQDAGSPISLCSAFLMSNSASSGSMRRTSC